MHYRHNHVIANQSADWCGNPFSYSKNIVIATFLGDADCHVALLLAKTWSFVRYCVDFRLCAKSEFDHECYDTERGAMRALPEADEAS